MPPLRRRSSTPRPPAPPSLPRRDQLEPPRTDLDPDAMWNGVLAMVDDGPDPLDGAARIGGAEIRESVLEGVALSGARAEDLRLTDVHLVNCDLSGMIADGAGLTRVRFTGCRLTGLVLSAARLTDVTFEDCHADLLNLRMSRLDRVRLAGTRARQADLLEAQVTDLSTEAADLREADVTRAWFAAADLRGADLEDVRGVTSLRGAVISPEQTVSVGLALIAAAGIRIE